MPDDTIVIKAPAGTKARWVRMAGGMKLSDFVVRQIDAPDPEPWLARFAARSPGESAVLSEAELRALMRRAYLSGAYRE